MEAVPPGMMGAMGGEEAMPPTPITNLKDTISETSEQISKIRKKTQFLIQVFITEDLDPTLIPNMIKSYDSPLAILDTRLKSLNRISFPLYFSRLIDHAEVHGATALIEILGALLNIVHGLKTVFIDHYDRNRRLLDDKKGYQPIYELLIYREEQVKAFVAVQQATRHPPPEAIRPAETLHFCPGALAMLNGRDAGKVRTVTQRELTEANAARVKRLGGTFLWWECPAPGGCNFRVKFHMVNSMQSNIHVVDETRELNDLPIEWRSGWLAKVHLFNTSATGGDGRGANRRSSSFGGWGSGSGNNSSSSSSSSQCLYGCVFCFAEGRALSRHHDTAFTSARGMAEHIVAKHAKSTLPPSLLLMKFKVAVKGKVAQGVRRWDVNFK